MLVTGSRVQREVVSGVGTLQAALLPPENQGVILVYQTVFSCRVEDFSNQPLNRDLSFSQELCLLPVLCKHNEWPLLEEMTCQRMPCFPGTRTLQV